MASAEWLELMRLVGELPNIFACKWRDFLSGGINMLLSAPLHLRSYYIIIMTSLPVRSTPGLTPHRLQMRGYYIMNMTSLPVGSRLLGRSYVKDLKLFLGDFQLYHRHKELCTTPRSQSSFLS